MRSFGSIVTLRNRPEILAVKHVIAREKLHGRHFRLEFPLGFSSPDDILFGSHDEEHGHGEKGDPRGLRMVRWFKEQPGLLQRMVDVLGSYGFSEVLVGGEACGTPLMKGVKYTKSGEVFFVGWGIKVADNYIKNDALLIEIFDKMCLPLAPIVWSGEPSEEAFDALLDKPSIVAAANGIEDIAEGVVICAEPQLRTAFGEPLIIKHKREKFTEETKPKEKREQADLGAAEAFAERFVLPGRIRNVLGHITALKGGMQDMALLVPAMLADLLKECRPEWDAVIASGINEKTLRNVVTRKVGVVYRALLEEDV